MKSDRIDANLQFGENSFFLIFHQNKKSVTKIMVMLSCFKSMAICLSATLLAQQSQSFEGASVVTRKNFRSKYPSYPVQSLRARRRRSLDNDGDEKEESSTGIPQLPAFGASSFSNQSIEISSGEAPSPNGDSSDAAFVSPKFKLQYTCNVCDTRNSHMVSRMAYRSGMVIAICKGCKSKHLIADNLNETPGLDGDCNIEDYFRTKGMEDSVMRVTPDVFNLEQILRFDSESGSLVGDDGEPVLE